METHTSSFAFIFLCFFDFRLSTFTHCGSAGTPCEEISPGSEDFSFFEGTDEDEEGRFMVVALWEPHTCPALSLVLGQLDVDCSAPWA